jgi:hypothetical protein
MAYLFSRNDRFYCAKQTAFATIRNAGGAASVAAADACKHVSFSADPARTQLNPPDKEVNAFLGFIDRSRAGRFAPAAASVVTPLFSGSGAGVAPDNGPIFESALGKETIVAATSVTYGPSGTKYLDETTPVTCELWGFNTGAKRGKVAFGALVNRLRISAGQDFAEVAADFLCYNVLTQDRFAAAACTTAEKGGLTSWPAEPGGQTYTGNSLQGFTGNVVLDGVTYTTVRNVSVTCDMGRQFRADKFDDDGTEYLPTEPMELMPTFTLDIDLWSTDSSDLTSLLVKIANRTAFDATLTIGATAGGIYTVSLNNLIMPDGREAASSDGDDRKVISLTGLRAQCTSTSVRDECTIAIT